MHPERMGLKGGAERIVLAPLLFFGEGRLWGKPDSFSSTLHNLQGMSGGDF